MMEGKIVLAALMCGFAVLYPAAGQTPVPARPLGKNSHYELLQGACVDITHVPSHVMHICRVQLRDLPRT